MSLNYTTEDILKDDKRLYIFKCSDTGDQEFVIEENCILKLLEDGVLFLGQSGDSKTVTLHVNCSDVFWWGTADCEDLPHSEIGNLTKMHMEYPEGYGSTKWACLRRNLQPQIPLKKRMIEKGAWDAELESLPGPERS